MKPFRFPLQPVRLLRERKEQVAQQNYAAKLQIRDQAEAELQRANQELTAAWTHLGHVLSSGTSASELRQARFWCTNLETRQKECAAQLQQAGRVLEAASRELMVATRARKTLDRLHDKQFQAHQREAQLQEQKLLDEMGLRATPKGPLLRGWSARSQPVN